MKVAADTFAAFVDILAAHLDDHEQSGDDLAARAYLSRFHIDRVVSAAAGEAPTHFRRRVLLERAAYRLLTSDVGILDVAVEAGYSSHEAFTRAFGRAFGATPSTWRARPGQIQIPAPSGVHFHPPSGIRLPARRKEFSMDLVTRMVEHHVWLIGQMVDRAERLADHDLDAVLDISVEGIDEDEPTLRWLLSRLVGQMDMWTAAMAARSYDFSIERVEPVDSIRSRLDRVGPQFVGQVRDVSRQGRFDETFVQAISEVPVVMTYGGMIAHVLTFAAHHRILAVTALSRAGVTDLGFGDPGQWVAEPA